MSKITWTEVVDPVKLDAHKTRHQDGGTDEVSVTGLSGLLADDQHVLDAEVLTLIASIVCNNNAVVCNNNEVVYN